MALTTGKQSVNTLAPGTAVEIVVDSSYVHRYLVASMRHIVQPTTTIRGVVVPTPAWMGDNVSVADSSTGRVSYLNPQRIISINNKAVTKPALPAKDQTWTVSSSKGKDSYVVRREASNGRYSCTCAGFQFRRNCRHIDDVRKAG